MRPNIPNWFPVGVIALLKQCWATEPSERPSFSQILQQSWFDHILVDYYINDCPIANQFWKLNFLEQIEVPIDDFLKALSRFCSVAYEENHPSMKLWRTLVARSSNSIVITVDICDFSTAISWYGPIQQPMDLLLK